MKEHMDLGINYHPEIGIHVVDISLVLERSGFRIVPRAHCQSRIRHAQRVTTKDAMEWYFQIFPSVRIPKETIGSLA
jgi:hypothetical protein